MKAVVITAFGKPDVLRVETRPRPTIVANQVLIQVKAAGINRPDIFQRKGYYPAPKDVVQDIPGLEVAGVVIEVGSGVRWEIGDEVCCLVAGGGYAEFVAVDADSCLPLPVGLTFAEAASLPETLFTVWDNVFRRGELQRDEHILIHGGAGGIGSTAIQLAKAFGARVSATAGSDEKCKYCRDLGADRVFNYKEQDFEQLLEEEGVDLVLDSIAGDYFEKHLNILRPDGRLVQINAAQGKRVSLDISKLMQKRLIITGSTLRARDLSFKAQLARDVQKAIWPILGHTFKPQVYRSFPFTEAAEAHSLLENGDVFGKLVLIF
ncbi:NAD(P)H-quinone oxidoreductase [Sphingobacterium griseoflavum]|uniref:NAD(P)H quinone oxidoreductase n=1 Tax=Sphingobacterium griseoflavum TaxID=1474952 RepID=A0ABQ3I0U2_9SPHI|nr:NAD(P)H-quinone oxidoreductase [Sphingobacterium griseoflavum]GHE42595.1 NAD(P)H quinone oxidoreductase [Sphingobacterium griseoflavum]